MVAAVVARLLRHWPAAVVVRIVALVVGVVALVVGVVAFVVEGCAGWVGLAREVGAGGEPKVFVLNGKALEGLEEEGEGLAHGGPGGGGH